LFNGNYGERSDNFSERLRWGSCRCRSPWWV
jgi:hypothetical protein